MWHPRVDTSVPTSPDFPPAIVSRFEFGSGISASQLGMASKRRDAMTALEKVRKYAADQDAYYSVMVDGNRHREITKRIVMPAGEIVTASRCREIVAKIQSAYPSVQVGQLRISMDTFDYSEVKTESDAELCVAGDWPAKQLRNKHAIYFAATNTLQIWQDGLPIYENANGSVCRDKDALADCLC